ncbi:hypothetical protein [Pinibacter aurantiacus]|uniref:Uncharacterized protein n=1 Tax=Pinibacter aurantiacus TaxID=2851599 RepID=A0A9E2SDD9_9BACT|nr:hypothetical protein [Pinibacter aurantiacus]MBV4360656.1 hypothetical protein [Pinibacter aurantiacus]
MERRPITVVIVGMLFILAGCMSIAFHVKDFFQPDAKLSEVIWALVVRLTALVCGILLFFRVDWARWLAVIWLLYHVIIGALHSKSEMAMHIVLLIVVAILLFVPVSSAYFRYKGK